jgi:hypothetical protein
MNNLRITPCKATTPDYKPGEILTITPRKNPKSPETYLVLRQTPNQRGVLALPLNEKSEKELNIMTIEAVNGSKNVQKTGKLDYVA